MNIVSAATRVVAKTAEVTTAAAGAIGGAAVSGVLGGLRGAASGIRTGFDDGSHSTAAAALTIGAVGAAGLVEWPVLLTVGGAALAVRQRNQRSADSSDRERPTLRSVPSGTNGQGTSTTRATKAPAPRQTARKASKTTNRSASRPAKKASARRRPAKK